MPYSIAQIKDDLAGGVHGKTVNKITNITSAFRRAANNLLAMIDPDETRRIAQITIYDGVTDYADTNGDIKDKGIIDFRPQGSRSLADNVGQRFSKEANLKRLENTLTVMNDKGTKFIRTFKSFTPAALTLDDLSEDTGWTATAVAQNLAEEDIIFPEGALQFGISGAGTGYLQSTTIDSQDLTDYDEKSSAFLEFYIPTAAALALITSVTLRWGNSATVYWSRTVTAAHLGALKVGRNLLRFDWNGATETGTVDPAAIDTARISVVATGAISGLIVSGLFFSIGRIWDLEYYSKFLFSASGTWAETVTDDDTTINLDTTSYNLYLFEVMLTALQQIQGKDAIADRSYFYDLLYGNGRKQGQYALYEARNPSQTDKPASTYYGLRPFRKK